MRCTAILEAMRNAASKVASMNDRPGSDRNAMLRELVPTNPTLFQQSGSGGVVTKI